jgi:small conductance mechanosensitive channel
VFNAVERGGWEFLGFLILKVLLIIVAGLIVKRILLACFDRAMKKAGMEKGLQKFLKSTINIILWIVLLLILLESIGIAPKSFLAVFGVAGLALSLAVKDSLANFAGGINLLVSKAFVVGDYIEIEQDAGTVHDIGMIHTTLQTVDNRRIMLPNSKVMSARVINYTTEEQRRVDISFSASYEAPIEQVQDAILHMISEEKRAYAQPEPTVLVKQYGDSAIEYTMRVWCHRDDYWDLYFALLGQIKPALDAHGVEMTYPHLNVHIQGKTP